MKILSLLRCWLIASCAISLTNLPLSAASIQAGSIAIDYDPAAFANVFLTTINSFNQAASNSSTDAQILADAGTTTAWSNLGFGINPTTPLSDPSGRSLQETTFTYDPANLTGTASGQIGIGGVSRWWGAGVGNFVLGDFALTYNASLETGIYSGWALTNNFSLPALAFQIANASTSAISADGFTLSGDLWVKSGDPLNLYFSFPAGDYGNFSMTASTVPEPSTYALLALAAVAVGLQMRKRFFRKA